MTNIEPVVLETVSEELLPCPFCGWKPDVAHDEHAADVFCPNEECIGVKSVSYAENIGDGTPLQHAIAAWNRRSPVLASRLAIQAPDGWQGIESAFPSLDEAYASALVATELFYDEASVEETNWTGWGEQTVPFEATWRRVKARQAFDAIRDADRRLYLGATK